MRVQHKPGNWPMGELHITPENDDERLLLMGLDRELAKNGYELRCWGGLYESSRCGCGLLRIAPMKKPARTEKLKVLPLCRETFGNVSCIKVKNHDGSHIGNWRTNPSRKVEWHCEK